MTSANKDAEIRLTGDSRRSPVYFFIFSDLLLLTAEVLSLHFLRRCIFLLQDIYFSAAARPDMEVVVPLIFYGFVDNNFQ